MLTNARVIDQNDMDKESLSSLIGLNDNEGHILRLRFIGYLAPI